MNNKLQRHEARLMEVFGFNSDDLFANQKGALSKRQASSLRRRAGKWLDFYALAIVIGFAADAFAVYHALDTSSDFGSTLRTIGIITVIALIVLAYAWFMRSSELLAIDRQEVETLEGRVHLDVITNRYIFAYRLEIEGIAFEIRREVYDALDRSQFYRLYYSPVTKTILSIEATSPGQTRQRSYVTIRESKANWFPPFRRPR